MNSLAAMSRGRGAYDVQEGDRVLLKGTELVGTVVSRNITTAQVAFSKGDVRLVQTSQLEVLTSMHERERERERIGRKKELTRQATQHSYYTPETVEQAFAFGRSSAYHGHEKMRRHEFLMTSEHAFPDSLWIAYAKGYRLGKSQRQAKAEQTDE